MIDIYVTIDYALREGRLQGRAVAARPRNGTINLGFAMDDRTSTDQGPARTHARTHACTQTHQIFNVYT